ncbi:SET and MYND domain-containing protein 4-like [Trichogramma pretiosum]|uniref:SET and MYND domain-containing protein 4-like n=1 Tax=Trichogramma pretiosum TaxID=7493 RepID=UPI000C71C885|nr:SET and MYND domain-containing protein 4-like [Trichogramma pretiosum]
MDIAKEKILAVKKNNTKGYGMQKECEALVGYVLKNMIKSNMPPLVAEVKNDKDSAKFREEGNQSFVSGDDDDAIEKYTMSLAFAKSRESMGLAFANRSAALYRKQLYRECLIDIDAALGHGYPEDKRIKLKERAVKAVASLRQLCSGKDQNMNDLPAASVPRAPPQPQDSSKTTSNGTGGNGSELKDYALIKNIIEDGKSSDKSSQRSVSSSSSDDGLVKESLEEMMSKSSRGPPRYVVEEGELALAYGANDEVPALSKGATIVYTEKYGRHLVATQHFKAGDIILTENPYAYVIYREKYYTHCHHCLTRSFNLISCPHCPIAQYCSEKCMRDAWQLAHQLECPIHAVFSKLLNVDKDKIRILTKITRMLIIATKSGRAIDELRKDCLEAEKNPDKRKQGFTDAGIFDSASARCALSLATNLPVRPPIEISAFSCISALAVILLALRTKFFQDTTHTAEQLRDLAEKDDDMVFCAAIVFRSCVIISSNSFSVQQEPGVKVGSGLYVTASLLNHSCCPNTFRHYFGLQMVTRALEPIKPGDQIFTCYGGGYQYMGRSERRRKMAESYFFDCDCQACAEDWPIYLDILRNHVGSIAKTNRPLVDKLKPYRQRLLADKYDIDAVKSILEVLYAEAKMPCEEIVHAVQYLKSYYLDP